MLFYADIGILFGAGILGHSLSVFVFCCFIFVLNRGCDVSMMQVSVHVYFNFKFVQRVRNVVLFADPLFQAL